MADLERSTPKSKSVIYIGVLVELYNWRNREQVHEIHGMIKFEKMRNSIAKNPRNLAACRIIEIFVI